MTRTHLIAVVASVVLASACGKSAEERGREDVAKSQPKENLPPPAETTKMGSAEPVGSAKAPEPPAPEPTTPEEVDKARKQAMIDGKHKDVIKYCEMTKMDAKTDPQVLLGCTLAACQVSDAERARNWAKTLPKLLMDQAVKTCTAMNVAVKPAAGATPGSGSATP
jgi:hypothetical protein